MKNVFLSFAILINFLPAPLTAFGQKKLEFINGFKYAFVGILQYQNGDVDVYGLSSYLKGGLSQKGLIVLDNESNNWPQEAKNDPCLIGKWYPSTSGGNRAGFIIKNCKDETVYENFIIAVNWVNDYADNYYRAIKKAFEPINSFKYHFVQSLTPIIVYPQVESVTETEETLKQYFTSNKLDPIEGIYKSYQNEGMGYYKIGLKKRDDKFIAIILEADIKSWKPGEIKAYFEPSSMNGFYAVKWYMGNKTSFETFGVMENEGLLSIELKGQNGEKKQNKFIKMYPGSDGKGTFKKSAGASGSGFFISTGGLIATNAHVIEGAKTIEVSLSNEIGTFSYKARVVLNDSKNDVALIQIDDEKFKGLSALPYGISEKADIGEKAFTIGYPLNDIMGTNYKVTDGIISAKSGISDDIRYYQISVPLQPGNSGGPLFNKDGNVIGITSAKLNSKAVGTSIENVNYAIKATYLSGLINMMPNSTSPIPSSQLAGKELQEQVKVLKNYVCIIQVN